MFDLSVSPLPLLPLKALNPTQAPTTLSPPALAAEAVVIPMLHQAVPSGRMPGHHVAAKVLLVFQAELVQPHAQANVGVGFELLFEQLLRTLPANLQVVVALLRERKELWGAK